MTEEYRLERLNEINIKDLKVLYQTAYAENRAHEYTRRKFETGRIGGANFAFLAYDKNNVLAGFYALFPVEITINRGKALAGQVADPMIHPLHRNTGLFFKLVDHTHQFAASRGMKLIFSFLYGTDGLYPVFLRYFDFVEKESLNGYYIKVPTLPIYRHIQRNKFFRFIYKVYYKLVTKMFIKEGGYFKLFNSNVEYDEIVKDENFINYKCGYSSCKVWELKNVKLLVKINPNGSIGVGDVDKNPPEEIKRAIARLKVISFLLGIRFIHIEASHGHILDKILSARYPGIKNRYVLYLKLDEKIEIDSVKFTFADIDTF